MKTLLSMALFLTIGMNAFAGTGWYVTINNQTAYDVTISPVEVDEWWPWDFNYVQRVTAYSHSTGYTEDKFQYIHKEGLLALRIELDDGALGSWRVEMWNGRHRHSVTKNISSTMMGYPNDDYPGFIGTTSDAITTGIYAGYMFYVTINILPLTGNANTPVADDLNGDGASESVLVSNTTWNVLWSTNTGVSAGVSLGGSKSYGDRSSYDLGKSGTPLLGDVDGDGLADPVVVNSAGWYVWGSLNGYQMSGPYDLGVYGGTPLLADFDGDGKEDPAIYVQTTSEMFWVKWLSGSNYQQDSATFFGVSGTHPVAGDIDGDHKADYAVVDASGNWLLKLSGANYAVEGPYALGVAGQPLLADFDADGKADPVMVSVSGGWYVWPSASGYVREGPHVLSVP